MQRRALIIGAKGQDGFYLDAHLQRLGYEVVSAGRDSVKVGSQVRSFDVLDFALVSDLIGELRPNEVYYLAAHHHSSQENSENLLDLFSESYRVHCQGLAATLEAIATRSPLSRLFYAASSLIFGMPQVAPQNEQTSYAPICAYGITKVAGIELCRLYHREKEIFCSGGILYNHESPRRKEKFITRKLVKAAVAASRGKLAKVTIGNLSGQVDWTAAEDTVRAMHAILQLDQPGEFVVASGTLHTVRDFADSAFALVGLDYRQYVEESGSVLQRAGRAVPFVGDSKLLREKTDWSPRISFEGLIEMMIEAELGASA